jgi:hypothetical protein
MADSGSASSVYMSAPVKGAIKKFFSALQGTTVGTANNVFTAFIGSTSITIDTFQQLTSGSAAGDIVSANVSIKAYVNEGDVIKITSDGGGTNTTPTMIYCIIEAH